MKIVIECLNQNDFKVAVHPLKPEEDVILHKIKEKYGNIDFVGGVVIKYLQANNISQDWENLKRTRVPGSKIMVHIADLEKVIEDFKDK